MTGERHPAAAVVFALTLVAELAPGAAIQPVTDLLRQAAVAAGCPVADVRLEIERREGPLAPYQIRLTCVRPLPEPAQWDPNHELPPR